MGPAWLRLEEVEPAPLSDLSAVIDGEAYSVSVGGGTGQPDDQGIAWAGESGGQADGRTGGRGLAALTGFDGDFSNRQPAPHVHHDRIQARAPRDDGGRHQTIERGRIPVEVPHLDPLVDQVVVVGGSVVTGEDAFRVGLLSASELDKKEAPHPEHSHRAAMGCEGPAQPSPDACRVGPSPSQRSGSG
jgi:hypothetical protein